MAKLTPAFPFVDVNRRAQKTSAIPRHREIIDFLVQKICKDLDIPRPWKRRAILRSSLSRFAP
ncbi:MAG: hypothetical protein ABI217_04390 [Chthoniobacterales bacterium]